MDWEIGSFLLIETEKKKYKKIPSFDADIQKALRIVCSKMDESWMVSDTLIREGSGLSLYKTRQAIAAYNSWMRDGYRIYYAMDHEQKVVTPVLVYRRNEDVSAQEADRICRERLGMTE